MGIGLLVLHGGGEALPGDELVALQALRLASAASRAGSRATAADAAKANEPGAAPGAADMVRVVILPLATARASPARTMAHVSTFLAGVARDHGVGVDLTEAPVVDRVGADDPGIAGRLASADLIVIPGGDPDLLPTVLPGSAAWRAILAARRSGAVVWGASAGAMAMATWCWTPAGGLAGLSLVSGLVVAPHVPDPSATPWVARLGSRPPGLGILTLAERTAIVGPLPSPRTGRSEEPDGMSSWRCIGAGVASWIPAGSTAPSARATNGEVLLLPG